MSWRDNEDWRAWDDETKRSYVDEQARQFKREQYEQIAALEFNDARSFGQKLAIIRHLHREAIRDQDHALAHDYDSLEGELLWTLTERFRQ